MKQLEVERLSKEFVRNGRSIRAVDGISFSVDAGSAFGMMGESGSGKTTTAYCLARLLEPTAGSIRFEGEDWLALRGKALRRRRHLIQIVFQDPYTSLNPVMTVRETIEEPLRIHGTRTAGARMEKMRTLFDQVGLPPILASRRPEALSGGQRQRVALARALACDPALLIADEPVSALDGPARTEILQLLSKLRRERNLTLILIAHDLETVRSVCERTGVIWKGRIVEIGSTRDILVRPAHPYTRYLIAAAEMRRSDPPPPESASVELREIESGHWAAVG